MTVIKLDYDHKRLPRDYSDRIGACNRLLSLGLVRDAIEETRRGWHISLYVRRRLSPLEIVALQAILGSDWKRELFNLARARGLAAAPSFWRKDRWNVFYARKLEEQ